MDIGHQFRLLLRRELGKIPKDRGFHRTVNVEPPAFTRNVRREPKIECWPILRQMLSRRQTLPFGAGRLAGEEAAFARAQRCLVRVSLLSAGGSFSSDMLRPPVIRGDASPIGAWCRAS